MCESTAGAMKWDLTRGDLRFCRTDSLAIAPPFRSSQNMPTFAKYTNSLELSTALGLEELSFLTSYR